MNELKKYLADGWSWVHFLCGWLGMLSFYLISDGLKIYKIIDSFMITLSIDVAKEALDGITSNFPSLRGRYGFDTRGGDIKDILMCLIGILIGAVFVALAL